MSRALTRPFAVIGTLAATLTLAACSGRQTSANEEPVDDGSTMFTAVRDACELPATVVQDGGTTLVLDGRGEDDSSASDALEIEEQACALGAINTPDHIVTLMDQTRALDGFFIDTAARRLHVLMDLPPGHGTGHRHHRRLAGLTDTKR